MFQRLKSICFRKKIYAYENYEGDKGIIIAYTESEARKIYQKVYPKRRLVDNDDDYSSKCGHLYELDTLSDKSKLYSAFEY